MDDSERMPQSTTFNTVQPSPPAQSERGGVLYMVLGGVAVALAVIFWLVSGDRTVTVTAPASAPTAAAPAPVADPTAPAAGTVAPAATGTTTTTTVPEPAPDATVAPVYTGTAPAPAP